MLHKKVLVMTLIIGMSMHMMKVVTSAVPIEEEVEQHVIIGESQVSIPVQGYIIPKEESEDVIPEQPKKPSEPEGQEVSKYPEEKEVREIPRTMDIGAYQTYSIMAILSLLWIIVLCTQKKEDRQPISYR